MCIFLKFWQVAQKMLFLDFSIFSSGGHYVYKSGAICIILVEGILGNIFVRHFFEF